MNEWQKVKYVKLKSSLFCYTVVYPSKENFFPSIIFHKQSKPGHRAHAMDALLVVQKSTQPPIVAQATTCLPPTAMTATSSLLT
jgi:hypothetical protein